MSFEQTFLGSVNKRFREYKALGDKTFAQLREEDFHWQPDGEPNSIAVIVQHLHGNMLSRWTNFLTEDGEKQWRSRDQEFEVQEASKEALIQKWNEGWQVLLDTLASLKEDDLYKTITIRSEPLPVADAIIRQIAHYAYHVGQIVYVAKMIRGSEWQTLSIPKGASSQFNEQMKKR